MKGRFPFLLSSLVLSVLLASIGTLAAPVNPDGVPSHPSEGPSSSYHPNQYYYYQQQQRDYTPHGAQVAAEFSQQYDPFQAWIQEQSTISGQYPDDHYDHHHHHVNPPSYVEPGPRHELSPAATQFAPPTQDSNTATSLSQEQQQQPAWLWDPSHPLTLDHEHPMNTVYGIPSLSSLPQPTPSLPAINQDSYYPNPEYQTQWQPHPEDNVSFYPSATTQAGGRGPWSHAQLYSHDQATPSNLHEYPQPGHYSIAPEHLISLSTSGPPAEVPHHRESYAELPPSSSHYGRGNSQEEGGVLTEAIMRRVPRMIFMREKWEEHFPPSERRKIIGTIVARWIELKKPDRLPYDTSKHTTELRKALRVDSAYAILSGDQETINNFAESSKPRGKGCGGDRLSDEEQLSQQKFKDLVSRHEAASEDAIKREKVLRRQEQFERLLVHSNLLQKGSSQYFFLGKPEQIRFEEVSRQYAANKQIDPTTTAQFLQYLKQNMTLDDINILNFRQDLSFQAWCEAYGRWQLCLQQQ